MALAGNQAPITHIQRKPILAGGQTSTISTGPAKVDAYSIPKADYVRLPLDHGDSEVIGTLRTLNGMPWRDASLLRRSLVKNETKGDDVRISVSFPLMDGSPNHHLITFKDCTYLKLNVDLGGRRGSAEATGNDDGTAWVRAVSPADMQEGLDEGSQYEINLVPPGGSIQILAKSLAVSVLQEKSPKALG